MKRQAPLALQGFLDESRARVEAHLERLLPSATEPPRRLHEAMRYAVLQGGKRLRPALAFGAALASGAEPQRVVGVAAAAELLHAYSLVHDDLPAMDDAAERRGLPSVHIRFGEATAILVGDALQAAAFEALAAAAVPLDVVGRLARAAGSRALVGGQADDLDFGSGATLDAVTSIHRRKTAALFDFGVWGAARTVGAGSETLDALERFALHYGLAFQLVDDLLDGAPVSGPESARPECSALLVLSPQEARRAADRERGLALAALDPLGAKASALRALGESVTGRLT